MAIGDKILASKYNSIKNKIDPILGAGSGASGYGQGITTTAVKGPSAGVTNPPTELITTAQWTNLANDIKKCYIHQNGNSPTITDTYKGLTIYWAHALQYDQLADGIVTNKDQIYTGGSTGGYTAQASLTASAGTQLASGWGVNANKQGRGDQGPYNITWSSADAARYFFNSGGYIQITFSRGGTSTNTKTDDWVAIVDDMGSQNFRFDATKYRTGVGSYPTVTSWDYTKNAPDDPYKANYGYMRFRFIDAKTIEAYVNLVDADTGHQLNIAGKGSDPGTVIDESVTININAGITYRKAVDQLTIESPTFTIPDWVLHEN
jgi:hypothetical protein